MREFLDAQDFGYEVIVAAEGDDDTPTVVQGLAKDWPELTLSAVSGRNGKGFGLRRGMRLTRGQVVGFLDADYKTPIDEVLNFLPWFDRGYQVVIGSRAVQESNVRKTQPLYRQIGARMFAVAMHSIVGLHHVRDTQCGFKFFTRAAARQIFSQTRIDGYMTDIEILTLAQRGGFRVKELGIVWRDDGDSRFRVVRDTFFNGRDLFRVRFGRYSSDRSEIPKVQIL